MVQTNIRRQERRAGEVLPDTKTDWPSPDGFRRPENRWNQGFRSAMICDVPGPGQLPDRRRHGNVAATTPPAPWEFL